MHLTRLVAALALILPALAASALVESLVLDIGARYPVDMSDLHLLLEHLAEVRSLFLLALNLKDLDEHVVAHLAYLYLDVRLRVLFLKQQHLALVQLHLLQELRRDILWWRSFAVWVHFDEVLELGEGEAALQAGCLVLCLKCLRLAAVLRSGQLLVLAELLNDHLCPPVQLVVPSNATVAMLLLVIEFQNRFLVQFGL